jgi:SAM-dependent methyltransferase
MNPSTGREHWNQVAQHWQHIGPPLRPCAEDIRFMESAVADWHSCFTGSGPYALLCGVTPEIADMAWPRETELVAVERSQEMIGCIWPGHNDAWRQVQVGDWLHLPLPDSSQDIVIGDGCFNLMGSPDGYRALAASLHRVLAAKGIFIMRFFVQTEQRESAGHVLAELKAGRIGSFHAFKWRLAMALQTDIQSGVQMKDIWQAWADAAIDRAALIDATGWQQATIDTIDLYRDKESRHAFLTLDEVRATMSEYFEATSIYIPTYELGERCPTLTFSPRAKPA